MPNHSRHSCTGSNIETLVSVGIATSHTPYNNCYCCLWGLQYSECPDTATIETGGQWLHQLTVLYILWAEDE